jgi:hypothetical protein
MALKIKRALDGPTGPRWAIMRGDECIAEGNVLAMSAVGRLYDGQVDGLYDKKLIRHDYYGTVSVADLPRNQS